MTSFTVKLLSDANGMLHDSMDVWSAGELAGPFLKGSVEELPVAFNVCFVYEHTDLLFGEL